jgi:hypothetical protein
MSHRFAIVLPDESARPILEAVTAARKSLRVKMFVFSDEAMLKAVIAAQLRRPPRARDRGSRRRCRGSAARRGAPRLKHSHPLDLSDAALLKDLQDRL